MNTKKVYVILSGGIIGIAHGGVVAKKVARQLGSTTIHKFKTQAEALAWSTPYCIQGAKLYHYTLVNGELEIVRERYDTLDSINSSVPKKQKKVTVEPIYQLWLDLDAESSLDDCVEEAISQIGQSWEVTAARTWKFLRKRQNFQQCPQYWVVGKGLNAAIFTNEHMAKELIRIRKLDTLQAALNQDDMELVVCETYADARAHRRQPELEAKQVYLLPQQFLDILQQQSVDETYTINEVCIVGASANIQIFFDQEIATACVENRKNQGLDELFIVSKTFSIIEIDQIPKFLHGQYVHRGKMLTKVLKPFLKRVDIVNIKPSNKRVYVYQHKGELNYCKGTNVAKFLTTYRGVHLLKKVTSVEAALEHIHALEQQKLIKEWFVFERDGQWEYCSDLEMSAHEADVSEKHSAKTLAIAQQMAIQFNKRKTSEILDISEYSHMSDQVYAFVDGSAQPNATSGGYGVVYVKCDEEIGREFGVVYKEEHADLKPQSTEFQAAIQAIQWAVANQIPDLIIVHDCAVIGSIGVGEHNITKLKGRALAYAEILTRVKDHVNLAFMKVKSHKGSENGGHKFNTVADQLAKKAVELYLG